MQEGQNFSRRPAWLRQEVLNELKHRRGVQKEKKNATELARKPITKNYLLLNRLGM